MDTIQQQKNYMPFNTLKAIEKMVLKTTELLDENLDQQQKDISVIPKNDTELAAKHFHAICEKIKYYQGYKAACNALLSYLDSSTTYTH